MKQWIEEQIKDLSENYSYYLEHHEEAEIKLKRKWKAISAKAYLLNITSMEINKKCGVFLGCYVAERVLSHIFKDVERTPYGSLGYDFVCNKGFKIDVKSCCLHVRDNNYTFHINLNEYADYFLCIGFDNRTDLNPQHIWLIKCNELIKTQRRGYKKLSEFKTLIITSNINGLSKFSKYELTDKLKETIECCNSLKT